MPRKERLITHEIDYIEYTCTQVRIRGRSATMEGGTYYLTDKARSKADALREIQQKNKAISIKIISIKKQEKRRGLFGMTESDYLEAARPMETRTKFKTAEEKTEEKEKKENEDNN